MNKAYLLLLSLMLATFTTTLAQNCDSLYWGTKTLYQPQQKKYTPAPVGYKPVYVNYVGRHGARHLTKDVATTFAYSLLQRADSSKALTTDGNRLKTMVDLLQKIEKPLVKFISIRGAKEQEGIGQRMLLDNASVFADKKYCLNVSITKEERTKQSSEAFLKGLQFDATASACQQPAKIDNDALRFFSIAPAYTEFEKHGSWQPQMDKLTKAIKPADFDDQFLSRFFVKGFYAKLNADDQDTFVDDIFGFSSIIASIQQEIINAGYSIAALNFRSLITCDQSSVLDELNSANEFLKKGPALDINGIQVRDAAPLLVSFINSTDEYIAHKSVVADLRFAHAETIAPFAGLLGLSGADRTITDVSQIGKYWKASEVIPLSSNIQWIVLAGPDNKYLVKFLLNEKEVAISGLPTKTLPYYPWASVRAWYINKLEKLNVKLTDDMHAYLLALH